MQFVEVTGENADTRRVAETILHRRIVQPALKLHLPEMIRQLLQQRGRIVEGAVRLRRHSRLIKAKVIDNCQQTPRRFHAGHLPEALEPRE